MAWVFMQHNIKLKQHNIIILTLNTNTTQGNNVGTIVVSQHRATT